jgi:hypothetical protein
VFPESGLTIRVLVERVPLDEVLAPLVYEEWSQYSFSLAHVDHVLDLPVCNKGLAILHEEFQAHMQFIAWPNVFEHCCHTQVTDVYFSRAR